MATIFVEATLAQKYKIVGKDGQVTGGPVYYIKAAYKNKFGKILAGVFAVLIIISLGFMVIPNLIAILALTKVVLKCTEGS